VPASDYNDFVKTSHFNLEVVWKDESTNKLSDAIEEPAY